MPLVGLHAHDAFDRDGVVSPHKIKVITLGFVFYHLHFKVLIANLSDNWVHRVMSQ